MPITEAYCADLHKRYTTPLALAPPLRDALSSRINPTLKRLKRIVIMIGGSTLLIIGVAMIVLPGPAFIIIPAGLAILAIEFAWARRWLRSAKAILPKPSRGSWLKQLNVKSLRRSGGFFFRQIRQTFLRKRKTA